jgi:alpha-L-rhamnosidase
MRFPLALMMLACSGWPAPQAISADRLAESFRDPPASARPHTWWHWMNGNVSSEGIRKDLEWLKRAGFAGFQLFEVDLDTPVIVGSRAQARFMPLRELTFGWRVAFGKDSNSQEASSLASWHESTKHELKYFSGSATYSNHFDVPASSLGQERIVLDLGEVHEVASVSINGRPAGIAWKPPYQLDVSDLLVPGRNLVEVTVANLWVNRLIGDAQSESAARAFTTAPTYRADAPLRPSGLIGPVRLLAAVRVKN